MSLPYPRFTLAYFIVSLLAITSDLMNLQWTFYLTKPLVLLTMIIFFYAMTQNSTLVTFRNLMLAGFAFSMGGDILLMFEGENYFIGGLVSFLFAHICYSIAFIIEMYRNRPWKQHWTQLALATLLVVFGAEFFILNRFSFGSMQIPILIYCIAITMMGVVAVMRDKTIHPRGYMIVVAGAIFFIISDALLATDMFITPVPLSGALIKGFYFLAQYLIGTGILLQFEQKSATVEKTFN